MMREGRTILVKIVELNSNFCFLRIWEQLCLDFVILQKIHKRLNSLMDIKL